MSQIDRTLAEAARAWPFEEARKLVARTGGKTPSKGYVLFETGYGPSGLPHIGTFGEVVRTTMVRQAFQRLSDVPSRLFCFSDDMDGLRKVPDNVPNKEMLAQHLGKPLTAVPDPFGSEHGSFGAANNARLRAFLDSFGFEYEFQSASDWYRSGRFDKMLLAMLRHYDEVQAVMLPTLGAERQATYSIFLPISPKTGRVLQVPVIQTNVDAGTIVYRDEDGSMVETPVTGGNVKLQWKADWAGRWYALGVDYEMYGKDLIPSAELSARIVKVLGGLAAPAVGCVPADHPWFGSPSFKIRYDPAEAKKLLAEAGYGPGKLVKIKIAISPSGSGQMYPLIMNEAIQQQWKEVGIDAEFQVMDWNALLTFMRLGAKAPEASGFNAINVSWNTMDPHNAFMRFIDSQQIPPKGSNWGYIQQPEFDALAKEARSTSDPKELDKVLAKINTRMVDEAVFVWVVHDVWPNAISSKVKGYVHPKSWYVDFSPVTVG